MSLLDYIQQTFPGVRITSTKRDPNSALGRANPRSYHNVGQAVDVAPIPGVSFEQYVSTLKQSGVPIVEAIDEVKHPSKHATGPHWHIAYGNNGESKPAMPIQQYPSQVSAPLEDMPLNVASQGPLAEIMQMDPSIANMPSIEPKKPGLFGHGGAGWQILGYLGDAVAQHYGGQPNFARMQQSDRENEQQMELYRQRVAEQREERMRPRAEQVGDAIGMLDPATGAFTPTYQAPPKGPEPTSIERNIEFLRRLRPDLSDEEAYKIASQAVGGQPQQPKIITYNEGSETITAQVNPDGSRSVIARGPRWQPQRPGAGAGLPPGFILDGGE